MKDEDIIHHISKGELNFRGGYYMHIGDQQIAVFEKSDDWEKECQADKEALALAFNHTYVKGYNPKGVDQVHLAATNLLEIVKRYLPGEFVASVEHAEQALKTIKFHQ